MCELDAGTLTLDPRLALRDLLCLLRLLDDFCSSAHPRDTRGPAESIERIRRRLSSPEGWSAGQSSGPIVAGGSLAVVAQRGSRIGVPRHLHHLLERDALPAGLGHQAGPRRVPGDPRRLEAGGLGAMAVDARPPAGR